MLGKELKMYKVGLALLMFAVLWSVLSVGSAQAATSKYTGGLLDGQPIEISSTVGQSEGTTETTFTDNNTSTSATLRGKIAWFKFTSPQEINSLIVNGTYSTLSIIEFYDNNNNLLSSYIPKKDDSIQSLPSTLSDVYLVALKYSSAYVTIKEFNVFTTPTEIPSSTTIIWKQAGDRTVTIDWESTGAKFYNVKRSETSLGPYATIASSVVGTTYTDNTVINGTTYYYVVHAANEKGESEKSPEVNVKPEATQYTGGLLDGKYINLGNALGSISSSVREMTDNNVSTHTRLDKNVLAWYTFSSTQEINSFIANTKNEVKLELYDDNNKLLLEYTALNINGIQSLPFNVQDVKTVVLKSVGTFANVYEWNVFVTPSKPPLETSISWIQGGDKVVNIEWNSTGAKTYNVKRSTSVGGPYVIIASNITTTSYRDVSVVNGTTYYYVVSASNEAGESKNSAQESITPDSTKYTGGLLDGVTLQQGATVGTAIATNRILTDNSVSLRSYLSPSSFVWHTFSSPKEITSTIVKSTTPTVIELYDDMNNLLYSYTPVQDDVVELLQNPVKNVTTVVLKPAGSYANVYEWNVFGSGGELPTQTPQNLTASSGDKKVSLNWSSVQDATSYNVKRSTTAGGPYTTVGSVSGSVTSYIDTNVVNGTTYYYVVTAVGTAGESARSNEASATPKASEEVDPPVVTPPVEVPDDGSYGNRALLSIVLINGLEKEYDLSMAEVNAFIAWYEGRAAGSGTMMYSFDKYDNNKGPFKNRRDYVFYDKILFFEVNGYDAPSSGNGSEVTPNPEEH